MPKGTGTIKKVWDKPFTAISNEFINAPGKHLAALGLYVYMWSKPDGWTFYYEEISKHFEDGVDAIASRMRELIKLGYVARHVKREKGRFQGYEYVLYADPLPPEERQNLDKPKRENPAPATETGKTGAGKTRAGKTGAGKSGAIKKDNSKKEGSKKDNRTNKNNNSDIYIDIKGIPASPGQRQHFAQVTRSLPPTLVAYAIELTIEYATKPSLVYTSAILRRWQELGITTAAQARQAELLHQQGPIPDQPMGISGRPMSSIEIPMFKLVEEQP